MNKIRGRYKAFNCVYYIEKRKRLLFNSINIYNIVQIMGSPTKLS